MTEPFMAEIRIMSFPFAPQGWALCNGALLPINQNQALFALLGTSFGGDGRVNFALPNLQGRTPIHRGNGWTIGQSGGEANHTLSTAELPTHTHVGQASTATGDAVSPAGGVLAQRPAQAYHAPTSLVPMNAGSLSSVGNSQPHLNMQPYLTLSFCIALQGIFPSQN